MKDAKVLLVIDSHHVDWSKYFRNHTEYAIRVEQGDIDELDVMCTEKNCTVELNTPGKDVRTFTPSAVFLGAGATRCAQLKTITRAFIAAHIPFLNSHTSAVAFLDRNNLKKQLKKITLSDGASIPMLPIVHYPHFHKFVSFWLDFFIFRKYLFNFKIKKTFLKSNLITENQTFSIFRLKKIFWLFFRFFC